MRFVAHNFALVSTSPVVNVGITPLIAMLDCEQDAPVHSFALVSKFVGPDYSTTVYDVRADRLLRARHLHGMAGVWKDIARRRPHVRLLGKRDLYQPAPTTA
jgi:hypothetical protein